MQDQLRIWGDYFFAAGIALIVSGLILIFDKPVMIFLAGLVILFIGWMLKATTGKDVRRNKNIKPKSPKTDEKSTSILDLSRLWNIILFIIKSAVVFIITLVILLIWGSIGASHVNSGAICDLGTLDKNFCWFWHSWWR